MCIIFNVRYHNKFNLSPRLVRFYPGRLPNTKMAVGSSQSGSTDRKIDEYENKMNEIKELKDRETAFLNMGDLEKKVHSTLSKCETRKELEETKDLLVKEERATSAQFLEELKQDNAKVLEQVRYSKHTDNSKESVLKQIDQQLAEASAAESKALAKRELLINASLNDVAQEKGLYSEDSNSDLSSLASFGSSDKEENNNNNNESRAERQSPLDYVLEKQSCEPSSITELDGED
jgi:hypothetical protein